MNRQVVLVPVLVGGALLFGTQLSSARTSADPAHLHCSTLHSSADQSACNQLSTALADEGTHLATILNHYHAMARDERAITHDQQTVSGLAHEAHGWDDGHRQLIITTLKSHQSELQEAGTLTNDEQRVIEKQKEKALAQVRKMID